MRIALLYPPPWKIPAKGEASDALDGPPAEYRAGDLDADFYQTPYGLFSLGAQALRAGHQVKVVNLSIGDPYQPFLQAMSPLARLLDWLACEFMDCGWDLKHMIRLMVNSDAYQRTSVSSRKLRTRDPLNREIAVQSRWRLDAELVRDNALSVSGLLVEKIGGPSVMPYQPDGYWENLNFPVRSYDASSGPDQYRRGLYVWWQRSYLHPSLLAFDAPTREFCTVRRVRTNTPLQALTTLNDPAFFVAAQSLGRKILQEGGQDATARVTYGFRRCLTRRPTAPELNRIVTYYRSEVAYFQKDPKAAGLVAKGFTGPPEKVPEAAAWTMVSNVLLNLDEALTEE